MNDLNMDNVKSALRAMGYDPDEIDQTAKDEVSHLMDCIGAMEEAMQVRKEDECPTIDDEPCVSDDFFDDLEDLFTEGENEDEVDAKQLEKLLDERSKAVMEKYERCGNNFIDERYRGF